MLLNRADMKEPTEWRKKCLKVIVHYATTHFFDYSILSFSAHCDMGPLEAFYDK